MLSFTFIIQIDAKPAVPKDRKPDVGGRNGVESETHKMKVFLGGLKPDVTEDDIRAALGNDKLSDVVVMVDKVTGKTRGFGFATFVSVEEASEFMQGCRSRRVTINVSDSD